MTDNVFIDIEKYLKAEREKDGSVFTDEEVERLITSFITTQETATEEEIIALLEECKVIAVSWATLDMTLKGVLDIGRNADGELTFALTEIGKEIAEGEYR